MQRRSPSVTRHAWIAVFLLTISARSLASDEQFSTSWDRPTLHVLWHDAHRIYPPGAVEPMAREVKRLFAANGIAVRVHATKSGQSLSDFPEPRVSAVLHPVDAEQWSLEPDVMAAAVGEAGKTRTIFVFYPDLIRTLGYSSRELTPRRVAGLARGTGRVVAHELVHVLAPERGHTATGLMAEKLTRRFLLKRDVALDSESGTMACAAIETMARSIPRIADAGADRVLN